MVWVSAAAGVRRGVWTVRSVSESALMMGKIVKTIRVIVLSNSPFQQHPKPLFSNIPIYT